ncbi:MAG TPA: LamG domain-containing protein [Solirubrobacterales bacterium]|nr:LamG domain-containing protein [Solirubrobacterales bacterium]
MVLSRTFLLALVAAAGCGESLFDAHGKRDGGTPGGDGGPDGPPVPESCPDECVGDAVADFDKLFPPWRYLDDGPAHTWIEMERAGNELHGKTDPPNRFRRCRDNMSEPACQELPDGLLVSSAGAPSPFIPALELTAPRSEVLYLSVRARFPGQSTGHKVRLYRNSREDTLFTERRLAGSGLFERTIIVDALAGDRFLLGLEPVSGGGDVAVQFFVSTKRETTPRTCRLGVPFTFADGGPSTIDNHCGPALMAMQNAIPTSPTPNPGPYAQHGTAGVLEPDLYFRATAPLARSDDMTVQFWISDGMPSAPPLFGWMFSNLDLTTGGGLGIRLCYGSPPKLEVSISGADLCDGPSIDYPVSPPPSYEWHFVRVVHRSGSVTICLDGVARMTAPLLGPTESAQPPHLGRNGSGDTLMTFSGPIDDLRVFSEALPCDPP